MRTAILLLFVLLLQAPGANAQVGSSCVAPWHLTHAYGDDVKDLALKRMYDIQSPDTVRIAIPQRFQDTIMAGLAAILNTGYTLQADSVFNAHCIHQFPYGIIYTSLTVKLDTHYAWTHAWRDSITTTGNSAVDALMAKYGFKVTSYWLNAVSGEYMNNRATIKTTQAINSAAFADSLAMIPGVAWVEKELSVGDYDHISYTPGGAYRIYTFSLGWGDCSSGCENHKRWVYTVDNSCNVSLTSVNLARYSPEPEPTPLNCNLIPLNIPRTVTESAIAAYPNPCTNVLHVSMGNAQESTYTLTDSYGRVVSAGSITTGAATVNISSLASGIYVLRMMQADGASVYKKVVKE